MSFAISTSSAPYFIQNAGITRYDELVPFEDWIGIFNGDVCVGSRKWDTSLCNNGICECLIGIDCNGDCGGGDDGFQFFDECGVCGGDCYLSEEGNCPDGQGSNYCDCDGNYEDICGVCGGDAVDGDECGPPAITDGCELPSNNLYLLDTGDVLYNSDEAMGGFQFNIDGTTTSGASGGAAEDAGFTVNANGSIVLGFSFTGASIPAGCGTLTTLALAGDATGLSGIVISDPLGSALDFEYYAGPVIGCMDMTACNYNADAVWDDGTCEYPEENFDCDGNCVAEIDCNGDCGGSAEIDECGVCDGPGTVYECGCSDPEPGYDCDGNFVLTTVQVIHNSASPTVDVYVDGALAVEDFAYRTATPLLELSTSFTVGIAPANGDVIAEFPFNLEEGGSYVVVATGLLGDNVTPFGLAATATTFGASSSNVVGLEVYHGSTDAPAVDIWADDSPLLTNFSYGDFSGFVEVPAADYTLGVAPAGGDIIAAFTAPLSGLGGGSAVVFASGFLSGDDPAFGLFAALNDGTVLELPVAGDDNNDISDGCDLPSNNLYLMGNDVLYNSSVDIGGFQFGVEGADILGASGGDAATSGFTVSASATTVLGFSFTGAVVPAGCGTLTSLSLNGEASSLSGIVVSDQSSNSIPFRSIFEWHRSYILYYYKHFSKDYGIVFNTFYFMIMVGKLIFSEILFMVRK